MSPSLAPLTLNSPVFTSYGCTPAYSALIFLILSQAFDHLPLQFHNGDIMRPLFLFHGYGNVFHFLPVLSSVPFLGLQNLSRAEGCSFQTCFYIKLWVSYVKGYVSLAPHFWALQTAPTPPPSSPLQSLPHRCWCPCSGSRSANLWSSRTYTFASYISTVLLCGNKYWDFRILLRNTLISVVKGPWRM